LTFGQLDPRAPLGPEPLGKLERLASLDRVYYNTADTTQLQCRRRRVLALWSGQATL